MSEITEAILNILKNEKQQYFRIETTDRTIQQFNIMHYPIADLANALIKSRKENAELEGWLATAYELGRKAMVQQVTVLTRKIEKITPGGSEFHGDINKCIEWITDRLSTTGKIAAERNDLQKKLRLAEDKNETYEEALQQIENWSKAYPLDIFPEPDFKQVRVLLEAGGITVDQVSASNMRHVVKGVGEIATKALARIQETNHE